MPTLPKASGLQSICEILKEELKSQESLSELGSSAAEFVESLLKDGTDTFLNAKSSIPLLLRLEIAYTFFSNKEITEVLENLDERNLLLKKVEELLTLHVQGVEKNELSSILQEFRDHLDLREFLSKIQMEIAPNEFDEIQIKIENDTRIKEIIAELKKPPISGDQRKERSVRAQISEIRLKIGQCFIRYCENFLKIQDTENMLLGLFESLDLDEAIQDIQQITPPRKFKEVKVQIQNDATIQKAIIELKQIQLSQEGDDEILQVMLKDIWERFSTYLPLDQEIRKIAKQQLFKEVDLESIVTHLQENLAPNVFNPMKASLDNDTMILDLINVARNLKEKKEAIIKTNELKDQLIMLLNHYKPQIDDESLWKEVQIDLKKQFNLERSLSLIQEFISPLKYKKLVEQTTEDTKLIETIAKLRLKDFQYHFIVALDGSGSMSGNPWNCVKKGVSNLVSKLKQYEDRYEIALSIIIFNSNAQTVATYENLGINLDLKLIYPGGGTNFDAPLEHALALIKDEKGRKFNRHFILFYTDGTASHPSGAMTKIKNFADKSKISLFAWSEEANPIVLKVVVNEFKQFGNGELKSSISPDMLIKELPDVLNSIFS